MKKSLKNFSLTENYKGHTILVYGELWEEGYVDGIVIRRAKFSKDGRKVMDESITSEDILLNRPYTRTRYFNMGWSICSPMDRFDENVGIELCKKRFRKSPLKTETGLFLTKDMVQALLRNEIEYIKKNWAKFVHEEPNAFVNAAKKLNNAFTRKQQVNETTTTQEVNETEKPISNGDYVRIFNPLKKNWPEVVGCVESVVDNNVYLKWVVKYGENNGVSFSSFSYSGIELTSCLKENVRLATTEEISNALKNIEKNTRFHWNASTKQLEMKHC